MKTYSLLELRSGSNKILLTLEAENANKAREAFRLVGYPLDRNSYLKVGDTTYCVAVPVSQD